MRVLLAGAFSGSPDSLIDKCTQKIKQSAEFDTSEMYSTIKNDGRNLDLSEEMLMSLHYGSKEIHLLFNYWYGFNYEPSFIGNKPQIDHIFPQSALKKIKDKNPNTDRNDILHYKWWDRDQFANLMLLTAKENGAGGKSDILPKEWFATKSDDYLKLHLIPTDKKLWEIDKYEDFIIERRKLIKEKFSDILITPDEIKDTNL